MRSFIECFTRIEWQLFLKDLIDQGADLHCITHVSSTPFVSLFQGLFEELDNYDLDERDRSVTSSVCQKGSLLLRLWLERLQTSGVDLTEYGRQETEIHQEGLVTWNGLCPEVLDIRWFLKSLTYGPSPCDWKLDMELRYEATLESQGNMPGGWIEDGYCERKEEFCLRVVGVVEEEEGGGEEEEEEEEEEGENQDQDDGDEIEERDS